MKKIEKFERRYILVQQGNEEPVGSYPFSRRGHDLASDCAYQMQIDAQIVAGWVPVEVNCPLDELHHAAMGEFRNIDLRLSVFCSKFNKGQIDTKAAEVIATMADTRIQPIFDTEGKLNFQCKQSDYLITDERESARIDVEAAMLIPARTGRMSFSISPEIAPQECSPIPEKGDEQLRRLALDLRSQGAENTHLIPKIEIARAKLTGSERDGFERQYRREHDAMLSNGFGPGALSATLAAVREIMAT